MQISIYAIEDENNCLTGLTSGFDDKEAAKFFVELLNDNIKTIENENEKHSYILRVRKSCIVKVCNIDLMTHDVKEDYNVLAWLKDFQKDVQINVQEMEDSKAFDLAKDIEENFQKIEEEKNEN